MFTPLPWLLLLCFLAYADILTLDYEIKHYLQAGPSVRGLFVHGVRRHATGLGFLLGRAPGAVRALFECMHPRRTVKQALIFSVDRSETKHS